MFLFFTPYTFMFFRFYCLVISFLLYVNDFYTFWILIEVCILILIGLSYTLFLNSFSFLIIYFLIQTLASFFILVGYTLGFTDFLFLRVLLKLGIFPFHHWFLMRVRRFPNFSIFLVSTLHKLPVFLIVFYFFNSFSLDFILLFSFFNFVFIGLSISNLSDLRTLLVCSSIGNNSWFLLALASGIEPFFLYYVVYSFFVFVLFLFLKGSTSISSRSKFSHIKNIVLFVLLCMRGFPPLPLFFCKVFILYNLHLIGGLGVISFLFVFSSMFLFVGYYRFMFNYLIYHYRFSL